MLLASGDPGAVQMEPDWPVNRLCAPYINAEREREGRERKNISDLHQGEVVDQCFTMSSIPRKVSVIQKE